MENEIMNNIGEVVEDNMDLITDAPSDGKFAKGFATGILTALVIKGVQVGGKWVRNKLAEKKKHGKVDIPDDITSDVIEDIPE